MATTSDEVWQLLRELIEAQKETGRQIKQVRQQLGKLDNRLGEFVEWQVCPAAVRLFQERGIEAALFRC